MYLHKFSSVFTQYIIILNYLNVNKINIKKGRTKIIFSLFFSIFYHTFSLLFYHICIILLFSNSVFKYYSSYFNFICFASYKFFATSGLKGPVKSLIGANSSLFLTSRIVISLKYLKASKIKFSNL